MPVAERRDSVNEITGQQVTDIDSLIEAFRSMTAAEIAERGFTVEGTFDQVDDPILLENPSHVVRGDRVVHLAFDVRR